jgi:hypothetical protein
MRSEAEMRRREEPMESKPRDVKAVSITCLFAVIN